MCNKKFSKSVPLEGMPNRAKRSNYGPSPPDPQRRPCSPRRRLSPWRAGPRPPTMCPTSLPGLDVDPPWMNITWWQSLTLDFTSLSVLWSPSSSSLWWITLRDKYLLKKEVVHLRAKTFDLVSGLTKAWWAFSGSVTALGSDNWSSHLCSAVLPTRSQIWDLVSIGKRLLKRSRKSPNFTHKSQISPLLRDAKQSPKFDILYWKHWFRDLASGIIIRKIESVSFGTFNDRLSARRLPRNTWEHKKQSLKPNQLSGDQTCQDNMRRLQGNIGKVSQCDAWGICRWFLKCSVGPFGDNLTSVERIWEDLIKCAELKCDAVDTSCKGVADVDAPHRFDKSAHLDKSLQIHQEI